VLPNVSSYEKSGSMVNALGRLQKLQAALPSQFIARNFHSIAFGLSRGDDREPPPANRWEQLFDKVTVEALDQSGLRWNELDPLGVVVKGGAR